MEALGFGLGFSAVVYFIFIPLLQFLVWVAVFAIAFQALRRLFGR